eukprot:TRINITY_DN14026_c0_g1_i1.p1 TRINITY_DN14026_c0_g1~~TRINITY_DN14026_c0_g1_i1.p1  ORF type:complete len:172 (-),score=12.69 TRINITY_DN14026_c0_g1_i1:16-531(-)
MNYWETMLTDKQKLEFIVHFSIRHTLKSGKFLGNSEGYQRKLRIEILPTLQLHATTEEIKSIGHRLMKIPFKKLVNEERKRKNNKLQQYVHKNRDIVICQIYRFVALHPDKIPAFDADKHIWQQIMQQFVFNDIGLECPQELMPQFITETKKLTRQYQYQNKLESNKDNLQ